MSAPRASTINCSSRPSSGAWRRAAIVLLLGAVACSHTPTAQERRAAIAESIKKPPKTPTAKIPKRSEIPPEVAPESPPPLVVDIDLNAVRERLAPYYAIGILGFEDDLEKAKELLCQEFYQAVARVICGTKVKVNGTFKGKIPLRHRVRDPQGIRAETKTGTTTTLVTKYGLAVVNFRTRDIDLGPIVNAILADHPTCSVASAIIARQ